MTDSFWYKNIIQNCFCLKKNVFFTIILYLHDKTIFVADVPQTKCGKYVAFVEIILYTVKNLNKSFFSFKNGMQPVLLGDVQS